MRKHFTPGVVLGIIAVGFAMSGSAVAGSLITSAKIKDGTIQNKDIKKGTIALNRLTQGTQAAIARARPGRARPVPRARPARPAPPGATAPTGTTVLPARRRRRPPRATGASSTATRSARRPRTCAPARPTPPLGDGALNLTVARRHREGRLRQRDRPSRAADFTDVDAGRLPRLHDGREHRQGAATPNMPGITFEIDPQRRRQAPTQLLVARSSCRRTRRRNPWSGVHRRHHDRPLGPHRRPVRGHRRATSTARAARSPQLQDVPRRRRRRRPTILSVAIGKGRDYFWSGAVDGLRINDTVFDFEERGVFTAAP